MSRVIISVIVPVYNSEKHLKKCIESILFQSFADFEIILINDGSKDRSGSICEKYALKDKRIQIYHQLNNGVSHARNIGLQKAIGEWVYFVDSDDFIQSGTFDVFFNDSKLSDVDIVQFGYRRIFNNDRIIEMGPVTENLFNGIDNYYENTSFHNGSLWLHFIKRSIISNYQIQFSENVNYAEDLEFTTKCYLVSENVMTLNKNYYNYYIHNESAMAKEVSVSSVIDHSIVLENLMKFIQSNKEVIKSRYFMERHLVQFFKLYLVRISMHSKWYYNLGIYQKSYNRMFSQTKSVLELKSNKIFLLVNRISIIPCVLYVCFKVKRQ